MSYLPPGKVKQGFWINWSQGKVLGSTITTDTTTANIIVAVLAIVVSLASINLWHLVIFVVYQVRAKNRIGNGLYHQQQALLRSSLSPGQFFWDFGKLSWTWWANTRTTEFRSFGLALLSLVFSVVSIAISLVSSFIVSTSAIPVLVNSNHCGLLNSSLRPAFQAYQNKVLNSALDYTKTCYLDDGTSGSCVKYVKPRINFTTSSTPCPFSPSMCISSKENPAITLDTGYIDSNDDFGINAITKDRVKVRKRTTCAPMKVSGYYFTENVKPDPQVYLKKPFPGEQNFVLEYGIQPAIEGIDALHYKYDTYESNFTKTYFVQTKVDGPTYGAGNTQFRPIEQLRRRDADTVLIWIFSNVVDNLKQVNDPVFSAHKKGFVLLDSGGLKNSTIYRADNPFGIVACAEQYQFCATNSNGFNCSELGGVPFNHELAALSRNSNQYETFQLLVNSIVGVDMSLPGDDRNALLALDSLSAGLQGPLPDNQWEREVNYWESFVLSTIQSYITNFALGPGAGSNLHPTIPPTASGRKLCKSQKMMVEGGFANISVFGLAFTIAISGIVVIADLLFLRVLVFLRKFYKFWGFDIDCWVQNGVLQLQRKAYEGIGQGNWTRRDNEIPLVGPDDQLCSFASEPEQSGGRPTSYATDKIVTLKSASPQTSSPPTEKS